MRLIQTTDYQAIAAMDAVLFPGDTPVEGWENITWWIGMEKGVPVCYCGVKDYSDYAYLNRAGVMPSHRGQGFQRRMIATRLKWAKDRKLSAISDTTIWNVRSSNNLIRAGFKLFNPSVPWGGEEAIYWRYGNGTKR